MLSITKIYGDDDDGDGDDDGDDDDADFHTFTENFCCNYLLNFSVNLLREKLSIFHFKNVWLCSSCPSGN